MILVELNWGRTDTRDSEPTHNGPVLLCDVFKETWGNCILIEDHLTDQHDIRHLFDGAFAFGDYFYSDIVIHAQELETRTFMSVEALPTQYMFTTMDKGVLLDSGEVVFLEDVPEVKRGLCQKGDEYLLTDEGLRYKMLSAASTPASAGAAVA